MNPLLANVYSTILPSAPFVIAAYAIIWIAVAVFVAIIVRGTKKNERDLVALRDAIEELQAEEKSAGQPGDSSK